MMPNDNEISLIESRKGDTSHTNLQNNVTADN